MADETDTWEQGGHRDKKFEISLTTYVPPPPVPPHISRLLVSIDGLPAPDGTVVTAWMDGLAAATALTTNGAAIIRIEGDGSDGGRAISFTIEVLTGGVPGGLMEDLAAAEVDFWEQGGHIDKNFSRFRSTLRRGRRPRRLRLWSTTWLTAGPTCSACSGSTTKPSPTYPTTRTRTSPSSTTWKQSKASRPSGCASARPQHFLGRTRPAGWSLVVLP